MWELIYIGAKAVGVTGMVMVLANHVDLVWWEGGALSFGIMILFGGRDIA